MKLSFLATGVAMLLGATSSAWAVGTLAISSVAHPAPSQLQVTGTCVQGVGQVSIQVKKVSGGSWTNLATSGGSCGAGAATTGKTITVNSGGLVPGMYRVRLKQGGSVSAPSAPISLP